MIIHPAVIALVSGSVLVSVMLMLASFFGVSVIRHWNLKSGSELQLNLERKTYLISTLVTYTLLFQLASFFLFIFTADHLHGLFVGAMCAAGTLNVNEYGYPALILKMTNFLLAGVWLIVNYVDNRGYDYPLIRKKYAMLLILTPLVLSETVIQGLYFIGLKADLITSCCGSLFSGGGETATSDLASLPRNPLKIAFFGSIAVTVMAGIFSLWKDRGRGVFFSLSSLITFFISMAALVSFLSLYIYELPTHHCPFCMLQREYRHIGYIFYIALLAAAITGSSVGALAPFSRTDSLRNVIAATRKKLVIAALLSYLLFAAAATYVMGSSPLILEGYYTYKCCGTIRL
ncbi:MAG: hypothetical protein AB1442_17700 [Nitrospirota bacterium]